MTTNKKNKKLSPFDFVKMINSKEYPTDEQLLEYEPYIVNLAFSYFQDCISSVNKIPNEINTLPKKMLFDYLYYSIPKKNRFESWNKKDADRENKIEMLLEYDDTLSRNKAIGLIPLIDKMSMWDDVKKSIFTGGVKK